ncbi:lactonase family protein [Kosakonia radicincitans]|uniref:6-phosphogluconolactonase, cycloisomerase 2 family n=1 Tax=Kosakonia radicincitans TaxID=283686 RepID=A0AAX2EXF6_9ENTR|nr:MULTISPECIES: lactonase family protein [Kosakonia]MDP9566624.1 6-phosphogluconolactonase (cycloisomerase 2 family) [Kosakonia oryzae]APG16246.1 6-phosphogluconolactonase [Kosakonia radicincitans]KDE36404.1 6-phosphogluconolactonase [Kosakonia radicincitans UMEnt01/12]NCF07248.1 lactonase family protein [Kosakonia sp. MH5]QEM93479.1 lactonase family protein [Kosakonia radicincitans]
MHTARHLLAASLSLLATSAIAQTQYAWVGTYNPNGEGVYRFTVDPQSGALGNKTLVSTLPNAAQLTVSQDGKTLYVASEVEKGVVQALRIDDNGALQELNQVSSGGAGPVYLALTPDGRYLLVANYVSGSIAVLPVKADGSLGEAVDSHQDQGEPGAAKPAAAVEGSFAISDHNGPHAHMIAADPQGKFVFSTDLGLDRIYQYRLEAQSGKLTPNEPPFINASSKGAGPRHFVFTPKGDGLWLINEEASTLTYYTLDSATGTLKEGKTTSALPATYKGTSFAAGLVLSRDGKQLYVANRLHNSVAHFSVQPDGTLAHQDDIWTRGDYPRSLTLDKQGRWLYVMNQRSDNITRFRVAKDGKLSFVPDYTPVGSPSQMVISSH